MSKPSNLGPIKTTPSKSRYDPYKKYNSGVIPDKISILIETHTHFVEQYNRLSKQYGDIFLQNIIQLLGLSLDTPVNIKEVYKYNLFTKIIQLDLSKVSIDYYEFIMPLVDALKDLTSEQKLFLYKRCLVLYSKLDISVINALPYIDLLINASIKSHEEREYTDRYLILILEMLLLQNGAMALKETVTIKLTEVEQAATEVGAAAKAVGAAAAGEAAKDLALYKTMEYSGVENFMLQHTRVILKSKFQKRIEQGILTKEECATFYEFVGSGIKGERFKNNAVIKYYDTLHPPTFFSSPEPEFFADNFYRIIQSKERKMPPQDIMILLLAIYMSVPTDSFKVEFNEIFKKFKGDTEEFVKLLTQVITLIEKKNAAATEQRRQAAKAASASAAASQPGFFARAASAAGGALSAAGEAVQRYTQPFGIKKRAKYSVKKRKNKRVKKSRRHSKK